MIAMDTMGRKALRDSLQTIRLKKTEPAQRKIDFNAGVLELHAPWAQGT